MNRAFIQRAMIAAAVTTAAVLPMSASADNYVSGLREVEGTKYPNSPWEGVAPVTVKALRLDRWQEPRGFTDLLPYTMPAPDQEDAGTCLYMAHTGAVEWWLAKLNPSVSRASDGPLDVSERFTVNIAGVDQWTGTENWLTDTVNVFNRKHYAIRNSDYRYAKGWYSKDANGRTIPATRSTRGASYGTTYNWINGLDSIPSSATKIKLPKLQREILFADPARNQWNTGIMPDSIVDRVKHALKTNKAPVIAIYNHFGYWHATMIVGYDENASNGNCAFVNQFLEHNLKQSREANSQSQREIAKGVYDKTKRAFDRGGGCHKGVFYVRDSIYTDKKNPYDYDFNSGGTEGYYTEKLTLLEFDWLRTMGNHAYQITAKPVNPGNRSSEF